MNAVIRYNNKRLIAISFLFAFILQILNLPDWLTPYRPDWVALLLIFWCFSTPDRVGVGVGWVLGLMLDILSGSLIGQHAMSLSIVAFAALKLHQRTRVYQMWQQALTVLLLLLLNQLFILWINGIIGRQPHTALYWVPSIIGCLLWPWLFRFASSIQRSFKIS